jgi:hypothetical protein
VVSVVTSTGKPVSCAWVDAADSSGAASAGAAGGVTVLPVGPVGGAGGGSVAGVGTPAGGGAEGGVVGVDAEADAAAAEMPAVATRTTRRPFRQRHNNGKRFDLIVVRVRLFTPALLA